MILAMGDGMRRSTRWLVAACSALLLCAGPAVASSENMARDAVLKDVAILKRGGDTLARATIENCYRKVGARSRVADVEACFMLDFVNNRMDQVVRQNLGMTDDPTGFHNDTDLLLRVSVPFARIGIEGSNAKALLADWTAALSTAMQ